MLVRGDLEPVLLAYDAHGRLTTIESGDGPELRSTTLDYFADGTGLANAGYLSSVTDALGNEVTFTRDAFGRALSASTDTDTTFFGYTARGHLQQLTTPGADTHLQEWNGVNLLTDYVAPAVSGVDDLLENSYDHARRLSRTTLPGNVALDVTRDAPDPEHPERHGRLRQVSSPSSGNGTSSFAVDFTYADEVDPPGPPGQLATLARGAIETEFAWDGPLPLGETTRTAGSDLRDTEYQLTWNADFALSTETVLASTDTLTAAFAYDQDGLLICAGHGPSCSEATGVTYHLDSGATDAEPDGHGLLEAITSGVIQETWTHSDFGELAERAVTAAGSDLFSISYERDALGRIVSQTTTRGLETRTLTYTYDAKGQLTVVTDSDPDPLASPVRAYKYDPSGNRLCITEDPEIECAEEAEYDAQDRLKQMDGVAYSYTDRGTLHHRADGALLETFTYDALGNLTRLARGGAPDIDYVIDAQGRRVGKRVDGDLQKQYVWGGALRIVAELDDSGDVVSRFIYGNGLTTPDLIVRKDSGSSSDRLYRVISDHLGSPIYVVNLADPSDVWLDATYDEWGNVTSFKLDGVDQGDDTSAWPIPQGFAGGLYDADTGLVRFGARDYDPRVGRWTAKDPILFEGGQGNLYVYVRNDPVNLMDPDGEFAIEAIAIAEVATAFVTAMEGALATTGVGLAVAGSFAVGYAIGEAIAPWIIDPAFDLIFAKGGKQNVRDTELQGLSDQVIQKLYDSAKGKERKRLEKELKGRRLRNKDKRGGTLSGFFGEDEGCE